MTNNAYKIAKNGGRHAGLLNNYKTKPEAMIQRAIRSMEKQIEWHESLIKNPYLKLEPNEDARIILALVNKKWPEDIRRLKAEADVLRGLLEERRQ